MIKKKTVGIVVGRAFRQRVVFRLDVLGILVDFQVKIDILPEPQLKKKLYSGWRYLIQLENDDHIRLQLSVRWQ